jgi:hypothetical protein
MTHSAKVFDDLIKLFRGEFPEEPDWYAVIALANHTLVSAGLYAAIQRHGNLGLLDADVRDYLAFIHERNRERNLRLRIQLLEAVEEFNRRDIVPILLKGAIPLFLSDEDAPPDRMTSDLDVAVDPARHDLALNCLRDLGYEPADNFRGMGRPWDVGMFELRPLPDTGAPEGTATVERNGLRADIPPPIARAEHWIRHDMIKEGDYVRGRLDLRHLLDLARLDEEEDMPWPTLLDSKRARAGVTAIGTQLYTLHALLGVGMPEDIRQNAWLRLHHRRRMLGVRHRVAGAPLRFASNAVWGALRFGRLGPRIRRDKARGLADAVRSVFAFRPRGKL